MVTANIHGSEVKKFQALETDQKLALLWFLYEAMGDSVTPAAPAASTAATPVAEGLFGQVKGMSEEEQLQVQRDLIERKNSLISREYGALSDTTKLLFWYLLAQGMTNKTIIQMPENYELSNNAKVVMDVIVGLDFQEQITLLREVVAPMGVDPATAAHDSETGL